MTTVLVYFVFALLLLIGAIVAKKDIKDLSILSLALAITMEESIVGKIVLLSALIVTALGGDDGETTLLFNTGVFGLLIVAGESELIKLYLGIEIVSLSFYILASRERKAMKSTEAGLKYFIMGALSSGILLMGITIVYAQTGNTDLELIDSVSRTLIIVGILFKLGAAPFHM